MIACLSRVGAVCCLRANRKRRQLSLETIDFIHLRAIVDRCSGSTLTLRINYEVRHVAKILELCRNEQEVSTYSTSTPGVATISPRGQTAPKDSIQL